MQYNLNTLLEIGFNKVHENFCQMFILYYRCKIIKMKVELVKTISVNEFNTKYITKDFNNSKFGIY